MEEPGPAFLVSHTTDLFDHISAIQTHTERKLRAEDVAKRPLITLDGASRLHSPDLRCRLSSLSLDLRVGGEAGCVGGGADGVLDKLRIVALLVETYSETVCVMTEVFELAEIGGCTNELGCKGLGGVFENAREALDDGDELTLHDGMLALVVHCMWF